MHKPTAFFVTSLLLVAISTNLYSETGTSFSISDPEITRAFELLNTYRKNAGLKPVILNEELSLACFAHSRYVVKNKSHSATQGLSAHYEVDSLPYATPQGKKAGMKSCIAYVKPPYAVEQCMNTFYHRMPLIDPKITEVGIGYYTEGYSTVCCIDMQSKYVWYNDTTTKVVVYPEPEALDITLAFQMEQPNPIPRNVTSPGYPITIEFIRQYNIKNVKVKVTDKKGNELECILSTPEKPLTTFPQGNEVCIIPVNRLKYNERYTVDFSCTVNGVPFTKKWSFYTRIGWDAAGL
ncbi:MAG: CAP domain-containing protein [Chitinophagales bacterium]|nr:CAP domain-containing protein [Chitinophagales bacterium]